MPKSLPKEFPTGATRVARFVAIILGLRGLLHFCNLTFYERAFSGISWPSLMSEWSWLATIFFIGILCDVIAIAGASGFFFNRVVGIRILMAWAMLDLIGIVADVFFELSRSISGPFYAWKLRDVFYQLPKSIVWNFGAIWLPLLCLLILYYSYRELRLSPDGVGFEPILK